MLTEGFFQHLAEALRTPDQARSFFIAVGAGDPAWDKGTAGEGRGMMRLVSEIARKRVSQENVTFLTQAGQPTATPTARVQFAVTFDEGEAIGTLRECGLFGGTPTVDPGSGTLLTYFAHPRLEKAPNMVLSRKLRIDLTPQPIAPGSRVTRYLGNTSTEEFHDRDHVTLLCQVDEIRPDRRYYFASPNEAVAAGYDFCAYCFDRERSRR